MITQIMPWKATGPGDVTILRARGRRLTKLITAAGVVDYEGAAAFEPDARRSGCVEDLAKLLEDFAPRSDSCFIRAALKPEFADRPKVLRRSRDRPGVEARFVEVPRVWAMVDRSPAVSVRHRSHGSAHGRRRSAQAPAAAVPRRPVRLPTQ
jgi:hypothetical protein